MNYGKKSWRLLREPPANGAWNMAVDETLLEFVGRRESPPTLRLYSWDPPCLSLGFAQPISDVDTNRLREFGWDLVRRPTGGRAILHTDELTYAVIGTQDDPRLSGGVLESYRRLSMALLATLHNLGVPAKAEETKSPELKGNTENPVCFEVPSNFEITIESKKIIGSAQARRKMGILQHGSLPLYGDLTRITQVLILTDEFQRKKIADRLLGRATTLESALGYTLDWEYTSWVMINGFENALNLNLIPGGLTSGEGNRAYEIYRSKHNYHPNLDET